MSATTTHLVGTCVMAHGLRLVVRAQSRLELRRFIRRLVGALALALRDTPTRWCAQARVTRIHQHQCVALRRAMSSWQTAADREDDVTRTRALRGVKPAGRLLRSIELANSNALGVEEAASRVRRYVAAHETPHDDRHAFSKLCETLFAQGLGFEVVATHWPALRAAFLEFEPKVVAALTEEDVGRILTAPIIRNRAKIEACIENARRWSQLAADGSYLACVASLAADDSAAEGWPRLVLTLQRDFQRLREAAARIVLKRWGFFSARSHAGAQRVLERLGVLEPGIAGPQAQQLIGRISQTLGVDPYAVEAHLAIFAANGPCRERPQCQTCSLSEQCAYATRST